jgi:hypothetical protein
MSDSHDKLYELPEDVNWKARCKKAQKSAAQAHEQRLRAERQVRDIEMDRNRWKKRAVEAELWATHYEVSLNNYMRIFTAKWVPLSPKREHRH